MWFGGVFMVKNPVMGASKIEVHHAWCTNIISQYIEATLLFFMMEQQFMNRIEFPQDTDFT